MRGIPHICFSCGHAGRNFLVYPHKIIETNHVSESGQAVGIVGMSQAAS